MDIFCGIFISILLKFSEKKHKKITKGLEQRVFGVI